jgi:hypothetical protein
MTAAAGDLVLFVLVASALVAARRGRPSRVSRWVREL